VSEQAEKPAAPSTPAELIWRLVTNWRAWLGGFALVGVALVILGLYGITLRDLLPQAAKPPSSSATAVSPAPPMQPGPITVTADHGVGVINTGPSATVSVSTTAAPVGSDTSRRNGAR
jgi:hypothetical protein